MFSFKINLWAQQKMSFKKCNTFQGQNYIETVMLHMAVEYYERKLTVYGTKDLKDFLSSYGKQIRYLIYKIP